MPADHHHIICIRLRINTAIQVTAGLLRLGHLSSWAIAIVVLVRSIIDRTILIFIVDLHQAVRATSIHTRGQCRAWPIPTTLTDPTPRPIDQRRISSTPKPSPGTITARSIPSSPRSHERPPTRAVRVARRAVSSYTASVSHPRYCAVRSFAYATDVRIPSRSSRKAMRVPSPRRDVPC